MDFDLSQALGSSSDDDEFTSRGFDNKDDEEDLIRIDEGLDLLVTHRKGTIARVANLVLAATRWKTSLTKLSDAELCSAIMENLVEETVVESDVASCTRQTNCSFLRMNSGNECTLSDTQQKAIILKSEELKLQAITLKGGYQDYKVNFDLAMYIPSSSGGGLSVVLSIKNSNWHISCSMQGDKAVLSLEECSKESLKQITDESMKRFLFYKRAEGISLTMFESVMCSGWFISTSSDKENQPVEMCIQGTNCRITNFKVQE